MRSITLAGNTYAKALDGYEGTYTLPDGTSTLTLDGYGNAGDGKTYVISGAMIAIYDGETVTVYEIDVESKTFLGKSKFAGYTFTNKSYKVEFDDVGGIITGKLSTTTYPTYEYGFTAVLDGNTLTITITTENYNMSFVGKTITATVSAGKLTFTSSFKPDNVTDVNGTDATCADFAG